MKKPSQKAYGPTAAETASFAAASKQFQNWKTNYEPLVVEAAKRAKSKDYQSLAKGRAQADVMQTLTKSPSLSAARSVDAQADLASVASQQMVGAGKQALAAQRSDQLGVLKFAKGQQADTASGLSKLAQIEASTALQDARNEQMIREANVYGLGKLASTYSLKKGLDYYNARNNQNNTSILGSKEVG